MSETEPTRLDPGRRPAARDRRGAGRASVERARLADDAPDRVEVLVVRPPADVLEPVEPPAPVPLARPATHAVARLMILDGWMAVAILAVALIGIFVLGLWFTR